MMTTTTTPEIPYPDASPYRPIPWKIVRTYPTRAHLGVVFYDVQATASLIRHELIDRGFPDDIEVTCMRPSPGMLATMQVGSDSYPYDVTEVSEGGAVITLRARMVRGGLTTENPNGEIRIARRRADGSYRTAGKHGNRVSFGFAESHLDPSF